ncbi:MAG: heme peroxidase family protein [Bacteroidota bacterium]
MAPFKASHGKPPRGLVSNPRSTSFEGTFGRMFRTLPAARYADDPAKEKEILHKLAIEMIADLEPFNKFNPVDLDDEENRGIPAGYTYLGQFIDHDLTFDPASSLQKLNDPDGLVDFRTPRFDLDNVYGRGPDDQPYLYEQNVNGPDKKMLLGNIINGDKNARDLPRILRTTESQAPKDIAARALIGDPRNDENLIVSQLQAIFLRFHNLMADILGDDASFEEIQKEVRWHYQWIVLHDFLPTIVGEEMVNSILPHLKLNTPIFENPPKLRYFNWREDPFMPVEFSVAAYRFGHSMVRPFYTMNQKSGFFRLFQGSAEEEGKETMVGFRAIPEKMAIDWDMYFNMSTSEGPKSKNRVQLSYKIDTSLSDPLGHLPPSVASVVPSLAERNLVRGLQMGLPSGQTVARHMGIVPIPDADLKIGKAIEIKKDTKEEDKPVAITAIDKAFADNAPLWVYILAEASYYSNKLNEPGGKLSNDTTVRLGPVGGRIVAEVFIGLLWGDSHSFLYRDATWKPRAEFKPSGEKFKMIDLIQYAQGKALAKVIP